MLSNRSADLHNAFAGVALSHIDVIHIAQDGQQCGTHAAISHARGQVGREASRDDEHHAAAKRQPVSNVLLSFADFCSTKFYYYDRFTNLCMIDPWKFPLANWGHPLQPEVVAVPILAVP